GDGRDGADIKAAQIIFAAQICSFKWGSNNPAISGDKRSLQVVTKRIAALLHWKKLLVLDDGSDAMDRPTEASELAAKEQTLAMVGRVGRIERVYTEAGGDLAGDDAVQSVGAGNASEVEILEQELGSGADRDQRRPVEGVADANPFEGALPSQRIA